MTAKSLAATLTLAAAILTLSLPASLIAQNAGQTLGSVRIPRAVSANGQTLAPGTYTLRLSTEAVPPVVGQTPEAARWVEFVQGGQVRGRELAVVVSAAEAREISDGQNPPAGPRVQTLRGGDYLRVWLSQGGTHYLLHLSVPQSAAR